MKGFTLIELLIVITIITVVSILVLANYPRLSETRALDRASQEIVLALRKAQNFALGTKESSPGSGIFPSYGVYFNSGSDDSYILFIDLNDDGYSGETEKIKEYKITTPAKISNLCGNQKWLPPGDCGLSRLDIFFTRPDPSTTLLAGNPPVEYQDLEIEVQSPSGDIKTIIIWDSGQIYVE